MSAWKIGNGKNTWTPNDYNGIEELVLDEEDDPHIHHKYQ